MSWRGDVSRVSREEAPSVVLGTGLLWCVVVSCRAGFLKTGPAGQQCQHCAQGSLAKRNPFSFQQIALWQEPLRPGVFPCLQLSAKCSCRTLY